MKLTYPTLKIEQEEDPSFTIAQIVYYTLLPVIATIFAIKINFAFAIIIPITIIIRLKK